MKLRSARVWGAVALAVSLAAGGLFAGALLNGGSFAPSVPVRAAPPFFPGLTTFPAVYDTADGYAVWLFPYAVTWTYHDGQWSNISATAQTPETAHGNFRMVYDAADGYVLLFGGATVFSSGHPARSLNDTWTFSGGLWRNVTGTVTGAPPPGLLGLMAYDSLDHEVVLFGGTPATQRNGTNDTWTFAHGVWSNTTVPGPPPFAGVSYTPSVLFLLADDPSAGYVVYYNPLQSCRPGSCVGQAWGYHAGAWTNLSSRLASSPRLTLYAAAAYDSTAQALIVLALCQPAGLYGCPSSSSGASFGTFEFDRGSWVPAGAATDPPPQYTGGSVDDPGDGGVLMVSGCCWADFSGMSLGRQDTWIYAHGTWTEELPWGGAVPYPWTNDGFWLAVLLVAVPVTVVLWPAPARPR